MWTPPDDRLNWELKESDITSEICKKCTATSNHCCQQVLERPTANSKVYELLKVMIENIPELSMNERGEVLLTCSHLKEGQCDIYENRPQLCRDFNCVTWTKRTGEFELYNKVLKIKKESF